GLRMTTVHEGFHKKDVVASGSLDDGQGFRVIERDWLLTENMLASVGGCDGPLAMPGMRSRDIDCPHLWIAQQCFIAAVPVGDLPGLAKCIRGLLGTTSDGQQGAGARRRETSGKPMRDASSPHDTPIYFCAHIIVLPLLEMCRAYPGFSWMRNGTTEKC